MKYQYLTVLLTLLAWQSWGTDKMTAREIEYKAQNLSQIGPRQGYEASKRWDKLLDLAVRYQDAEILQQMLKHAPKEAVDYAAYILDLNKIYQAGAESFLKATHAYFKKNLLCVVDLFKSPPPILEQAEIAKPFNKSKASKLFKQFISATLEYEKKPLKEQQKIRLGCLIQ